MTDILRPQQEPADFPPDEPFSESELQARKALAPVCKNFQEWSDGIKADFTAYFVLQGLHADDNRLFVSLMGVDDDPLCARVVTTEHGEGATLYVTHQTNVSNPGEIWAITYSSYPNPEAFLPRLPANPTAEA